TLDAGNASRFGHRHASGCIPGRVRLSLQPQEIAPSGNALLSLAGKCRRNTANEISAFKSQPNNIKTQPVVATVLRQIPHFHHIVLNCLIDCSMLEVTGISSCTLVKLWRCALCHGIAGEHGRDEYG